MKYRAEPFTGNRGELRTPGRLNHSSTTWWGDAQSWTGPFRGVGTIQTIPLFFKHVVQSWTVGGRGLLLSGRTYQMEFDVPCLIGTSAPAVGCSRPQWVGWVVLRGWHGAWGNLKEKSQLEVGVSPGLENFPVLPVFLLRRSLAPGGQMGWESLFPWQPEKAIPKVVLQPSPLGTSLGPGGEGSLLWHLWTSTEDTRSVIPLRAELSC